MKLFGGFSVKSRYLLGYSELRPKIFVGVSRVFGDISVEIRSTFGPLPAKLAAVHWGVKSVFWAQNRLYSTLLSYKRLPK